MLRTWRPLFPLDVAGVLGPLRRGPGDVTFRAEGGVWLTANTPVGPGTLHVTRPADVVGRAWGDGAEWLLDRLPALLGAEDDDSAFEAHHPLVAETRRRLPGMRLGAGGRVWDVLLPAVLEQKVTIVEAHRSYRELCRKFGTAAPGPAPVGMRVPPTPRAVLGITDWEWHRAGVDGARRRALIAAAQVAHRLEGACDLRGEAGRALLCKVPGIGVWTAAEIAQRAWGDPDAVSFGDFHLAGLVGWALLGRPLDDDGMAEVLAPYRPQRYRAVRYVEASGARKPRFGPRFAPRDYRAM
ncbi:3-methyladenine DNA glycosylase/8-oxoguanine DNA glycosylase [Saccharothrix tamanrassetensis]|uniref:3-methyladenine DNA glycosylase/8-oxoguanine DNA glycosylase n=1 Tax=Saccharothrix tamanrassetensis TaxID=1051531 RepID=A0A841CDS6_9PSEU|nr:DNA-3-methyladenine glycosylase 2 family protein [Saccharothrix tamanrassetensis]MBB5955150.1 3-methyladenine DNA glycosylase/8-oxoguanine DNA glycosylase [Saccharothrix tamanrassetensis]